MNHAAEQVAKWADKNERTKIGFDPIKEHDRCLSTRSFIGAKTKKMQSRVKQMEKRIEREIEEKEGLLEDIEYPKDLKLFQLVHYKNSLAGTAPQQERHRLRRSGRKSHPSKGRWPE